MTRSEAKGLMTTGVRGLLFIGRGNAALSQMAQGFARQWSPPAPLVESAGIAPARLSPWAIQVMAEVGIDITDQYAKGLTSIDAANIDLLVAVGGDLEVPEAFAGIPQVVWLVDDPDIDGLAAAARLACFRAARDVLCEHVARLRPSLTTNTSDN